MSSRRRAPSGLGSRAARRAEGDLRGAHRERPHRDRGRGGDRGVGDRLGPPNRQQRLGWAWDTAIEQTGGYFYSRLILLVINAAVTLGIAGVWPALVVTLWVVAYQQLENLWLSPRLSARTMEISGAVAFGSAIAGGAVAGPMGAFMALPVAALVTAFIRTYGRSYPLAYHSTYDRTPADREVEPAASPEPRDLLPDP